MKSIFGFVWPWASISWHPKLIVSCPCSGVSLCQFASKSVHLIHSFSKYHAYMHVGNGRTKGRMDAWTDERTGRKRRLVPSTASLAWRRHKKTRSALGRAHLPPTTVFRRLKTTRCCFDETPIPVRAWDFPDVIKFHVAALQCIWYGRKESGSGIRTMMRIGI